jgi:hypothetical protein
VVLLDGGQGAGSRVRSGLAAQLRAGVKGIGVLGPEVGQALEAHCCACAGVPQEHDRVKRGVQFGFAASPVA